MVVARASHDQGGFDGDCRQADVGRQDGQQAGGHPGKLSGTLFSGGGLQRAAVQECSTGAGCTAPPAPQSCAKGRGWMGGEGAGGVWGRQREGGAVGRQGPAGSLGLARTGRLPAAAASVLVQGGPSRGQTAGAAVQPAVGLQPSLQSGPGQPAATPPWQPLMASAAPQPAPPRSCPLCPISLQPPT